MLDQVPLSAKQQLIKVQKSLPITHDTYVKDLQSQAVSVSPYRQLTFEHRNTPHKIKTKFELVDINVLQAETDRLWTFVVKTYQFLLDIISFCDASYDALGGTLHIMDYESNKKVGQTFLASTTLFFILGYGIFYAVIPSGNFVIPSNHFVIPSVAEESRSELVIANAVKRSR